MAWNTMTMTFCLLYVSVGLAMLQLAVPVTAPGGSVQAQELLRHLHLLDISDGVVPLSEKL